MMKMKAKLNQLTTPFTKSVFKVFPVRSFRDWRENKPTFSDNRYHNGQIVSPYLPQFSLTEEERKENDKLPVEERVLDWQKYMRHKGRLKYSTGVFTEDVEPFPRLKIMMLCDIIMGLLRKFPDSFNYKHLAYNHVKYIMETVDQNEAIVDIELKISNIEMAEDVVMMLHDEVTLLQTFLKHRVWEKIAKDNSEDNFKELFFFGAAFKKQFGGVTWGGVDNQQHRKNERPERPKTAGF